MTGEEGRRAGASRLAKLATAVGWLSLAAMLALLLREGYELDVAGWLSTSATVLAVLAVGLSVVLDVVELVTSQRRRSTLLATALEWLLLIPIVLPEVAERPALWALAVFVRQTVVVGRLVRRTRRYRRFIDALQASPAKMLMLSFALVIGLGTVLLTFPRATTDGRGAAVMDAVFTATSATCVTGLATMNTVDDAKADPDKQTYTRFGQFVILLLIQIGGLGMMTLSAATVLLAGGRLRLRSAEMMRSILDEENAAALQRAIRDIFVMTFAIEAAGALILTLRFHALGASGEEAAWMGVFHSVSAFCNAGFSLFSDSLSSFAGDALINLTHSVLIIGGGLGFGVVTALVAFGRGRRRALTLQVRMVLTLTLVLLVGGTILYFFLEYDHSLRGLPVGDKLLASFFQSTSFRTAGFNSVDMAELSRPMLIFACILMFIGGGSGSTAGGVKTSTIGVILASIRAAAMGRRHVELGKRTVPPDVVNRAISIVAIAVLVLIVGLVLLLWTQPHLPLDALLFETVSALGTAGLSMGATGELDTAGKVIVIVLMFIGRVGPLTVALAVGRERAAVALRYPQERIVVG